MQNTSISQVQ